MCDPVCAGVAVADDPVLDGKGVLFFGGACWYGEVVVAELGLNGEESTGEWEEVIERVRGGAVLLFMDGSRDESGRVGGVGGAPVGVADR